MKFIIVRIFIFSFLVSIIISPLRAYNLGYSSLFGFTIYFLLTWICLNRFSKRIGFWPIFLALLGGIWIIQLPVRLVHFESTLITLPDVLLQLSGIVCGSLFWRLKNPFNFVAMAMGLALAAFICFQGYGYWLHKLNFGTFTGVVSASNLPAPFEATDDQQNLMTERDFAGKLVLLDFWHTRCGICFEKFPQLQAVHEIYKEDTSVMILAVNKPIEEDKEKSAFQVIKEAGYSFSVVVAKDEEMPDKFGVGVYPTTFVIDRNSKIIYKGDIEGAVRQVDKLKGK